MEKLPCNCWAKQILKSDWTTAEKANKSTAVSIKEIRKQENMKNASNQSKFTTEEKSNLYQSGSELYPLSSQRMYVNDVRQSQLNKTGQELGINRGRFTRLNQNLV